MPDFVISSSTLTPESTLAASTIAVIKPAKAKSPINAKIHGEQQVLVYFYSETTLGGLSWY